MTASLLTLLAIVGLAVLLLIFIVGYRTILVAGAKTPANSWTRGAGKWNNPGLITRAEHAHANCLEMLPLVGIVVLVAATTGQQAVTDGLAYWFLAARVAQTTTHLISATAMFATIRASFFAVQLAILVTWLIKLSGLM